MYTAVLNKICTSNSKLLLLKISNPLTNIKQKTIIEQEINIENRYYSYYKNKKREKELMLYYLDYSENDAKEIFSYPYDHLRTIDINGIISTKDTTSKFYNIINHRRITTDTPSVYKKSIYFFGNCLALGIFAEDKKTIQSNLQRELNKKFPSLFRVINCANWSTRLPMCRHILQCVYKFNKNDLIIILTHYDEDIDGFNKAIELFKNKDFFIYSDISNIFQRTHNYGEIFFDKLHMQHGGYKILSDTIFNIIKNYIYKKNISKCPLPELENYLYKLKRMLPKDAISFPEKFIIGSIVMNCNPFTNGHKFLIDEALKRCDFLYIFIIEEDKSFFTFRDRFAIVKKCLINKKNIAIVPSSKMIISSHTMPEYFIKDEIQDVNIDTSFDLNIFCQYIAPYLNISKRFVGSEPICNITSQYNSQMHDILPLYNIECVEIPRLKIDEDIVSASLVRKYISIRDYKSIEKLVPKETYNYILSNAASYSV